MPGAAVGCLVVLIASQLVGCSSEPTRDEYVAQFVASNPDATTIQAECVVDELATAYTLEGLGRELEAVPTASAFERSQFRAMFGCGLTSAVEDALEEQLVASGIDEKGAACASETLTSTLDDDDLDILLDGGITDEFYAKYFTSLDSCDAVP